MVIRNYLSRGKYLKLFMQRARIDNKTKILWEKTDKGSVKNTCKKKLNSNYQNLHFQNVSRQNKLNRVDRNLQNVT